MNIYSYKIYHFGKGRLIGQHIGVVFADDITQAKENIWKRFGNDGSTLSDDDIKLVDPEEGFNMYVPH